MTDRLVYILRHALRLKFGIWPTDAELDQFISYLASQGVEVRE